MGKIAQTKRSKKRKKVGRGSGIRMSGEKNRVAKLIEGEEETNIRERRGSTGNLDLIKRKREEMEEDGEERLSLIKKVQRSLRKGTGWVEEIKEELKKELKNGIEEMKEMMKEQMMETKIEIEGMKRKHKEKEEKWQKEKEEKNNRNRRSNTQLGKRRSVQERRKW